MQEKSLQRLVSYMNIFTAVNRWCKKHYLDGLKRTIRKDLQKVYRGPDQVITLPCV